LNHPKNVVYLKDRSTKLLEQAFRQYEPALRRFLRARLVPEADQSDLVQDIFLRLAGVDDLAEKLSDHSGNTQSYLFSIATHLIIDRKRRAAFRRESQHDSYEEDNLQTDQLEPDTAAALDEQLEAMMAQLNNLKPKCRQAFVLSRFEYKSYQEIATDMNLSIPSVERYITLALAALRKGLTP
jgi:RNA polymerase sigma factor (sigma-70 family)